MKSGKQDYFRHILKSSASIYESSSSQVFRTITGIQSTRDAFGKARVIMTFLTILCITKILCSKYRREGRSRNTESSRLEVLEKFSENNFALSDIEDKTS